MKKTLSIITIFFFIMIGISACKSNSNNDNKIAPLKVYGKWYVGGRDYFVFEKGNYKVTDKDGKNVEEEGSMNIVKDILTTISTKGEKRQFKIESVNDKELKLRKMRNDKVSKNLIIWKKQK